MEWLNDKAEQINKPLASDSAEQTETVVSQLEKKKKVTIKKYVKSKDIFFNKLEVLSK